MAEKIGLIGLGAVGWPLAESLIEQGFEVVGYRRSSMAEFEKAGGIAAKSPRDVAGQCDIVMTCVPNNEAVRDVMEGDNGVLAAGREGLVVIDLNTLRPAQKEEVRVATEKAGAVLLDAPFSGTPKMVRERVAIMFISGDELAYNRTKHVFDAMSGKTFYLGEFGAGTKMKLVANSLVGIHIVATAEAMAFGLKAGLDPQTMIDLLTPSAAGSLQFQVRAPMIKDKAFEPALASSALLDKDLDTIVHFADDIGATVALTRKAAEYMARTRGTALANKDCASVFEIIAEEIGLKY